MVPSPTGHPATAAFPALGARDLLFAIDVDGTLLTSRHEVTHAVVEAVRTVRARGAEVLLTTSRPPRALWPILEVLGLTAPAAFIGSQGAITGSYTADGRLHVIEQHPVARELGWAAAQAALRAGLAVNWFSGEDWFVSHLDDEVRREARIVGFDPTVTDLSTVPAGPDKLLVIAPGDQPERMSAVRAALSPELRAQTSNPTYLEITRADVDKATALVEYCRRQAIPASSVVAIGDGMNDLGMLAFAGTSVAPANARPEVLAAVDLVTASNDDDGVAHALHALTATG